MKRFNYDGNLRPTESRKFSCGITKINGEIGNSEDDNFYMRISNGYLSKIEKKIRNREIQNLEADWLSNIAYSYSFCYFILLYHNFETFQPFR